MRCWPVWTVPRRSTTVATSWVPGRVRPAAAESRTTATESAADAAPEHRPTLIRSSGPTIRPGHWKKPAEGRKDCRKTDPSDWTANAVKLPAPGPTSAATGTSIRPKSRRRRLWSCCSGDEFRRCSGDEDWPIRRCLRRCPFWIRCTANCWAYPNCLTRKFH